MKQIVYADHYTFQLWHLKIGDQEVQALGSQSTTFWYCVYHISDMYRGQLTRTCSRGSITADSVKSSFLQKQSIVLPCQRPVLPDTQTAAFQLFLFQASSKAMW